MKTTTFTLANKTLTFEMTNGARRLIENETGKTKREIVYMITTFDFSDSLIGALFLGAARKHHFKRFPSMTQVDSYFDSIEDEDDALDLRRDLECALCACYLGIEKSVLYEALYETDDDADDEGDEHESFEGEGEEGSAPKSPAPSRAKRQTKK